MRSQRGLPHFLMRSLTQAIARCQITVMINPAALIWMFESRTLQNASPPLPGNVGKGIDRMPSLEMPLQR